MKKEKGKKENYRRKH
jgi:hypothetical protein